MKRIPVDLKAATLDYLLAKRQRRRTSAERTHWLMRQIGLHVCVSTNVIESAFQLFQPEEPRQRLLDEARDALRPYLVLLPQGLECLPTCWLKALPGIWQDLCRINPRWAGTALGAVAHDHGVLRLVSAQEQNIRLDQISVFDLMRIDINARLYPSIWRPLKRRHERVIWMHQPGLRKDLFKLPETEISR